VSVKAGGSVTVPNISTGATKVSLKTANGWVFTGETRVEAGKAAAFSFSDRQQDFETKADGVGITIVNYKGQGASVVIPASVNGKNVTTIGAYAFSGCESLTSVTIPDGVTTIGERAFFYCESLTTVTIPDSVTAIGEWAFYSCASLTAVTIPNSVTAIGEGAFRECASLTSVTIPDGVTTIGEGAFLDCSSLTTVTIPDSVTTIGDRAFSGCASLKTISVHPANQRYKAIDGVLFTKDGKTLHTYPAGGKTVYTIPNSVTAIGDRAFSGCASLSSVTIPDRVTTIGGSAFSGCESLSSVTIPASVTSVGNKAFYGCSKLKPEVRAEIEKRFGKGVLE
jgi:hypothetical protein